MRLHFHWHKEVRSGREWSYLECRCGHRTARRITAGDYVHFAVDQGWLDGGEFRKSPTEPPPKPADAAAAAPPWARPLAVQPDPPPPGVPLDETTAPVHYEGDTSSV